MTTTKDFDIVGCSTGTSPVARLPGEEYGHPAHGVGADRDATTCGVILPRVVIIDIGPASSGLMHIIQSRAVCDVAIVAEGCQDTVAAGILPVGFLPLNKRDQT